MANPQQIRVNLDPNQYAITNMGVMSSEEEFGFQITSGNQVRLYSLTPKHAKRVLMLLQQHIEQYEKKFGELKTQLPTVNQTQTEKKKFGFEVTEDNLDNKEN
jgi:hypothetical protein